MRKKSEQYYELTIMSKRAKRMLDDINAINNHLNTMSDNHDIPDNEKLFFSLCQTASILDKYVYMMREKIDILRFGNEKPPHGDGRPDYENAVFNSEVEGC